MWSIDFTPSVQNTCGAIFVLSTRIGFTWLISSFFPYKTSPRWASATNWSLFSLAEAVYKSQYCPPSIVFPSSAIFVQKKKKKAEEMLRRERNKKGTGGKMSYGNCWRDPINGWCWVGSCRGLFLYQLPSRYLVIEFQRLWFPADVELIRLPQSTGQQEKWRRKVSAGNL